MIYTLERRIIPNHFHCKLTSGVLDAHVAVAAHVYADKAFVLSDPETSALAETEKVVFRFVRRLTPEPGTVTQYDIDKLKLARWDEPSIYCVLPPALSFNYYNCLVLGNGVAFVSEEAFDRLVLAWRRWAAAVSSLRMREMGMSRMPKSSPFRRQESTLAYPGWSVATAAFVGVMTSFAPIVPYTFSMFLNPLHAAFGWKRAAIDGTFAIAAITVALVSPFLGMLFDRLPPRRIILPSILIFAAALASLSRLRGGIGQFYLTFSSWDSSQTAPHSSLTHVPFSPGSRGIVGFALALILTGSGLGSILIPPATQWMIGHHGWRSGYLLLGAIALLGLPLTALLVRNRSDSPVAEQRPEVDGISVRAAFASAAFWVICGITILSAFGENGLVTNLAAILTEHGLTPQGTDCCVRLFPQHLLLLHEQSRCGGNASVWGR